MRRPWLPVWLLALLLSGWLTAGCAAPTGTSSSETGGSGLPVVTVDELPVEAQETLQLIDDGGPFPFDQDGVEFHNREALLPARPSGYYREFTVVTPGSSDRGARRIVAGDDGDRYYTDDHYASFREVITP